MTREAVPCAASEASRLYAGFARAFRYPDDAHGSPLSGAEYLRAFDPSASDAAASVHEAAYAQTEASALFEELVRFYEYFGLRRSGDAELPDHLSVELEFMHYLCELENHAEDGGADVASVRAAQKDFLDRHVRRLLNGLGRKLAGTAGAASDMVRACADFVELHRLELAQECRRYGR